MKHFPCLLGVRVFDFRAPHIQQYTLSGFHLLEPHDSFALPYNSLISLPSLISPFAHRGHFMRRFYQWRPIMSTILVTRQLLPNATT